jgi:NACHT domain
MTDPAPSPSDDNSDRSPQIQQNLVGNDNLVIGEMKGGIVIKHLTINDRIPAASLPPSHVVVQNLTQQEYRQRQVLLNKVKNAWVKGVLEKSLHARVSIELGLQERPDLVQQPFSDVAEFASAPGQALAEGTPATTVFDRLGSGRTLLIVGEPGSGKTIALLKLAADAIARTEPDLRQQIPVVFNLSSWARKPQSIEQWLIQELLEKYQVSKALGKTWVESEALMLLLDGLDEVKAEQRNACVQALNQFMQTHGTTEIVICCRIGDYQMLQDRLMLRSAICLQPLTAAQIDRYFEQAGDRLSALKALLPQDSELHELAKSPLMLSVMSLAYQDFTPEQLTVGGKIEDYRKRLFATYIDRMFQRRGKTQQYSREDSQRWLIWLAQRMKAASQTEFLIEGLQPSLLISKKQLILYYMKPSLTNTIIIKILLKRISTVNAFYISKENAVKYFRFGMIYSMAVSTIHLVLPESYRDKSYKLVLNSIMFYVRNHTIHLDDFLTRLLTSIVFGLLLGLPSCFIMLLVNGISTTEIQKTDKPNEGIYRSIFNANILMILFVVAIWLANFCLMRMADFEFVKLNGLLLFGMIGWLTGGGYTSLRHFILRVVLYCKKYSPWNYTHFLDYVTERLFLQKVGGGYIFVHRMLLEHFAEMSIEQEKR